MSTPRSRWSAIIAEHALSDLPVARFCAKRRVSTAAFYRWRRTLQGRAPSPRRSGLPSPASAFVEAVLTDSAPAAAAGVPAVASPIVELGSGRRIVVPRGFDEETLVRVVTVLERIGPSAQEARR